MGRKNVLEDTGCGYTDQSGVYPVILRQRSHSDRGSSEHLSFPGTGLQGTTNGVCTWKRETEEPEPAIFGAVPPIFRAADGL